MNPETTSGVAAANSVMPYIPVPAHTNEPQHESAVSADDRLDWEVHIPVAPQRRSGLIEVQLEYGGRGKPTHIDDPWA